MYMKYKHKQKGKKQNEGGLIYRRIQQKQGEDRIYVKKGKHVYKQQLQHKIRPANQDQQKYLQSSPRNKQHQQPLQFLNFTFQSPHYRNNPLHLQLSLTNYKQQFRQFIHNNNISKNQAKIIKQKVVKQVKKLARQEIKRKERNQHFQNQRGSCQGLKKNEKKIQYPQIVEKQQNESSEAIQEKKQSESQNSQYYEQDSLENLKQVNNISFSNQHKQVYNNENKLKKPLSKPDINNHRQKFTNNPNSHQFSEQQKSHHHHSQQHQQTQQQTSTQQQSSISQEQQQSVTTVKIHEDNQIQQSQEDQSQSSSQSFEKQQRQQQIVEVNEKKNKKNKYYLDQNEKEDDLKQQNSVEGEEIQQNGFGKGIEESQIQYRQESKCSSSREGIDDFNENENTQLFVQQNRTPETNENKFHKDNQKNKNQPPQCVAKIQKNYRKKLFDDSNYEDEDYLEFKNLKRKYFQLKFKSASKEKQNKMSKNRTPPKRTDIGQNKAKKINIQNKDKVQNTKSINSKYITNLQKGVKNKSSPSPTTKKSFSPDNKNKTKPKHEKQIYQQKINKKQLQRQQQRQNLLNQKIFHRLYNSKTACFQKKFIPELNQKQQEDYRVVMEHNKMMEEKYVNVERGEEGFNHQQFFKELYKKTTKSSQNRVKLIHKHNIGHNINLQSHSQQIQNIISQSIKNNSNRQKYPISPQSMRRQPNMSSLVYQSSPSQQKSCNCHCQAFEHKEYLKKQEQKIKQRDQRIKREIKQRSFSAESLSPPKNSPQSVKKSGECLCCHKEKIQEQRKLKLWRQKQKMRKTSLSNPTYSVAKKLIKYNKVHDNKCNLLPICDVLQQSYQELFSNK